MITSCHRLIFKQGPDYVCTSCHRLIYKQGPDCLCTSCHRLIYKQGPDYVRTFCHRLMYKQSVVPLNVHNHTKASPVLLADVLGAESIYTCFDGNQNICKTCNTALSLGNMPT